MASFSSSVINKSGKRFAPKIPARRAAATPAASAPSTREAHRQVSQTPQTPPAQASPSAQPYPSVASPSSYIRTADPLEKLSSLRSPQFQEHGPPELPKIVRIPPPTRRSPIQTTPSSQLSAAQSPPQQPATVPSEQEQPSSTRVPSAATRATRPPEDRHQTKSSPEPQTNIRPTKRIRVSRSETHIPVQPHRDNENQAVTAPTPRVSVRKSPDTPAQNAEGARESASTITKSNKSRSKRKKPADEIAAEVVEDAARPRNRRGRRKREKTPENAETAEVASAVVKMSDLCRDLRTGKKSKREMELRSMEATELAKKKKDKEARQKTSSQEPSRDTTDKLPKPGLADRESREDVQTSGPQMRIVNGEIVLDTSSLQIDRHADAARNAEDMEEVVENPLTRRINQTSFGKRTKAEAWDEESTDLFYRGLRMFGTDFMIISRMFPGRTRRHIKLKFCSEEKKYPERIRETLLGPREPVDLQAYSEMTDTVYGDPKLVQRELDEEKRRIEQEHAKEREAREEQLRNPGDGTALPSIENGADAKRGRNQKKKATKSGKFGGGTEEILGTIDDF
ncbi:hypothetical protein PRK78_007436 [Emydomyces testavorans]|uniref:Myb-like domain-containing protein n=1 Tax=Emydomyces testavorans TaxID=2070801 RepID=A0AAF0DN79_9EURO|nr:hypothetical protein PRK78_007436 [Emydomyces testavorans]